MYKEFEQRVLDGTRDYYNKQSVLNMDKFYKECRGFVEYMKSAKKLIEEEMRERAVLMHPSTAEALKKVLTDTLVEQYLDVFDTEFKVRIFAECFDVLTN